MRLYLSLIVCAGWTISHASAYFIIQQPQASMQWVNNAPNLITWTKGLLDGIDTFDLEMTRMSEDGLVLVAQNVPSAPGKLNLLLQDVPPGDDYFLLFINSTHGVMYATSNRFAILAPSATPSVTPPSPAAGIPTVTVSGAPNTNQVFATTFPALSNGGVPLFTDIRLLLMLLGCLVLTLGW